MTSINYQIEYDAEREAFVVYVFEVRGDQPEGPYSIGPDFGSRHEAAEFIREVAA